MTEQQNPGRPRWHITFRRVSIEQVGNRNAPLVFCPRQLAVLQVESCRHCDNFSGLCINAQESGAFLRCSYEDDASSASERASVVADADPLLCDARRRVAEIMISPVRCATLDMSLDALTSLFLSEKVGALPIVDASGRPIGIVTKADAMERYYDHAEASSFAEVSALLEGDAARADARTTMHESVETEFRVRDIMSRGVYSMGPNCSISRAAALMAYEQVHHVLILAPTGAVLGIVSSLDIARWLAQRDGYVVPNKSSLQA